MVYKRDFVELLRTECGYTKKAAIEMVSDFWKVMEMCIGKGEEIQFTGYGIFKPVIRPARKVTGPDGNNYEVPEHLAIRYLPGERIKKALDSGFEVLKEAK